MDEVERLAEIFKALSDPTRLKLVRVMTECSCGVCTPDQSNDGPLCVNALTERSGVSQSAVSQHLRILRQAGLIRGERHGAFIHYSIDQDGLDNYKAVLMEVLGEDFLRK